MFVIKNRKQQLITMKTHSYNTRNKFKFSQYHRLTIFERKPEYIGIKMFQALPSSLQNLQHSEFKFKKQLKHFLINHSFYNLQEFWEACSYSDQPNIPPYHY